MILRHASLKSTAINSHLGPIKLDRKGLVCNIHELKVEPEVLRELYPKEFLDARIFPPDGWDQKTPLEPEAPKALEIVTYCEEDYWNIIKYLSEDPLNLNSEGFIDMEVLLRVLRDRRMPVITGSKRKEITVKWKSKG